MSISQTKAYALLSVSDKTGVVEFAKALIDLDYQILSTGGTASLLAQANVPVIEVSEHIQFPEILDGRVKTLNPKIHGGILAQRNNPEHIKTLSEHGISAIDIVAVNLYPFAKTIAQANVSLEEAIEQIDIGGPTMVRASAKNHADVYSVVNPGDYMPLIDLLQALKSGTKKEEDAKSFRFELACTAFAHTASYDAMISQHLKHILLKDQNLEFAQTLNLQFEKVQDLRYGENPHQQAAFYRNPNASNAFANYTLLQGKELSYNNLADADAAWQAVKSFNSLSDQGQDPFKTSACVIVKHANPCGVALADTPLAAYQKALLTDKTSAFGGILAFNTSLDATAVQAIMQQFLEVLIAPDYSPEALEILKAKPNVRVLKVPMALNTQSNSGFEIKSLDGGILYQSQDLKVVTIDELKIVTKNQPSREQLNDLLFAFTVAKFIKSNAIVFCANQMTLGIGAGQMSRLDSAKIAGIKAAHAGLSLQNSVVASDAFFPFTDTLDVAIDAGATAVIQPGGSIKDPEVIARADERGIVMVFSGVRHFKH